MPFNFITLWKSEMKLKSFINCKSTYIYNYTITTGLRNCFIFSTLKENVN